MKFYVKGVIKQRMNEISLSEVCKVFIAQY